MSDHQSATAVRSARSADGARIEYEVDGDGPPLVLLHGLLASRRTFSRQRSALAARFRLILVSARGHDGSDATLPANYGVGTSDVDDLRVVLDAEGVKRAAFMGHSSGGATAFVFACQEPTQVERMVLIEPTLLGLLSSIDQSPEVARVLAAEARGGAMEALQEFFAATGGAAWLALPEAEREARLRPVVPLAPLVARHAQGLADLAVTEADVLGLRPPALFVYGDRSMTFEPLIADRLRALRPDLPLHVLDKAGHDAHRSQPEAFNALALDFLCGQAGG